MDNPKRNSTKTTTPTPTRIFFPLDSGPLPPLRVRGLHPGRPRPVVVVILLRSDFGLVYRWLWATAGFHYHPPEGPRELALISVSPVHWNHTMVYNELSGGKYSVDTH